MGIEGGVAKMFFNSYFQDYSWKNRLPRTKFCPINTLLDIGYTLLFNYIEAMTRLFGFDPYKGVYHQLWFRRKSLICDLIEPFRCLVEEEIRKSLNYGRFSFDDFKAYKNGYYLSKNVQKEYISRFLKNIIIHKIEIFSYIRNYYRCFMQCKSVPEYPLRPLHYSLP